jgi:hypothetical protein
MPLSAYMPPVCFLFRILNFFMLSSRFWSARQLTSSPLLSFRWLPHTDTLHALIKEYRDARKILLNIEHRLMLQMAPDYQHLTLMQKVEVFEYALANTTGQDLYKVLWLKSQNSEVCFVLDFASYTLCIWLSAFLLNIFEASFPSFSAYFVLSLTSQRPMQLMNLFILFLL